MVKQVKLTVGEALSDGGSRVWIRATFPLDISFLDGSQKTVVALISYTWSRDTNAHENVSWAEAAASRCLQADSDVTYL